MENIPRCSYKSTWCLNSALCNSTCKVHSHIFGGQHHREMFDSLETSWCSPKHFTCGRRWTETPTRTFINSLYITRSICTVYMYIYYAIFFYVLVFRPSVFGQFIGYRFWLHKLKSRLKDVYTLVWFYSSFVFSFLVFSFLHFRHINLAKRSIKKHVL